MATAKKKKPVSASQKYSNAVSKMEYDKKESGAYNYKNNLSDQLYAGRTYGKISREEKIALANMIVANMVNKAGANKAGTAVKKGFSPRTTYGQGKKSQADIRVLNTDRTRGIIAGRASLKRKRGGVAE
jgi:hypothetical protein